MLALMASGVSHHPEKSGEDFRGQDASNFHAALGLMKPCAVHLKEARNAASM
jgi:hypothetical protein